MCAIGSGSRLAGYLFHDKMAMHFFGFVTPVTVPGYLDEGGFRLAVVGHCHDLHPDALTWSHKTVEIVGDNVRRQAELLPFYDTAQVRHAVRANEGIPLMDLREPPGELQRPTK